MESSLRLAERPVWSGGSVLRCVSDGAFCWSEVWTGPAGGWVRGGWVSDTLEGFPVSAEDLATLGIPEVAIGSPVTDSPGRAAAPAPTPAPA